MTNESKFLGYLDSLKGSKNEKLIECVQEGFKTLVEYQVVGNMSERGTDLMEGEVPEGVPSDVVELIEKLTKEISDLQSAMQDIDDIADAHDLEDESTPEVDVDVEVEAERAPVEEAFVRATDGVVVPVSAEGTAEADREYEKAASKEETGGSVEEREPQNVPDVDPRDIDGIETGQRLGKVESEESEELPDNVRKGEAAGTSVSDFSDSEGKMANKQLDQIHDQAGKLAGSFEDDEQLKAWVQAKITKAQQTLDVIYEFFREEKGLGEQPEETEDTEDENPIFEK